MDTEWLAHTWGDAGTPAPPVAQLGAPELCAVRLILWDEYLGYVVIGEHPAVDLRQPINLILDDPLIGPAMVIGQIAPVGTRSAHPDDIIHVELHPGPLPGEEQYPVVLKPAYQPPADPAPAQQPPAHQPPAVVKPARQPPADELPATQLPATQLPATQPVGDQVAAYQPPAGVTFSKVSSTLELPGLVQAKAPLLAPPALVPKTLPLPLGRLPMLGLGAGALVIGLTTPHNAQEQTDTARVKDHPELLAEITKAPGDLTGQVTILYLSAPPGPVFLGPRDAKSDPFPLDAFGAFRDGNGPVLGTVAADGIHLTPEGETKLAPQVGRLPPRGDSLPTVPALKPGIAIETHNEEESNLAAGMIAAGKDGNQIQAALDDLRLRRAGEAAGGGGNGPVSTENTEQPPSQKPERPSDPVAPPLGLASPPSPSSVPPVLTPAREAAKYGRTLDEYEDLARDPSQGGQILGKTRQERRVGLDLERRGLLEGPIQRDASGAAEFFDRNGQKWDVKAFNSNYARRIGGFTLGRAIKNISKSLAKGEKVILDTTNLSPSDHATLKAELEKLGWSNFVMWWP